MRTGAELEGLLSAAGGTREVAHGVGREAEAVRDALEQLAVASGLDAPRTACRRAGQEVPGFLRGARGEAVVLTDGVVAQERLLRAAGGR